MTKPNGTAEPDGAQRLQALDAGHVRHVPVGQDQVRLLGRDLGQRVGAVLGLDDVVVVVAGLPQGADDDLPHDAAVVGDQDLHSGTSFSCSVRAGGSAGGAGGAPCTEMVSGWPRHRTSTRQTSAGLRGRGGGRRRRAGQRGRAGQGGLDVAADDVGDLAEGVGDVLVLEHRRGRARRAAPG